MLYACTASLLLIVGCVLFHYEALRVIGAAAASVRQHRRAVLVVIFGVVAAHLAEILVYALAMYLGQRLGLGALVGEVHPSPTQYFYLSAETYTTLGLGDIYPTGSLRLIASLEPLIGMLLIGWSGSYTYLAVQRYWVDLQSPTTRAAARRRFTRTAAHPPATAPTTESSPTHPLGVTAMSVDPEHLARRLLGEQWQHLSSHEREVVQRIARRVRNPEQEFRDNRTLGERASDTIAAFGGSWTFILLFFFVLIAWTILNTEILGPRHDAFDPYPYVFLNLILSMLAAIQAPIIMMSQNRAADRDRLAANIDHEVNVRAELSVRDIDQRLHYIERHLVAATSGEGHASPDQGQTPA